MGGGARPAKRSGSRAAAAASDPRAAAASRARVAAFAAHGEEFVVVSWPGPPPRVDLTGAEREVALLVAKGMTNAEIGKVRGTALRTVANQVATLLQKLGVPSRHHVARILRGASSR